MKWVGQVKCSNCVAKVVIFDPSPVTLNVLWKVSLPISSLTDMVIALIGNLKVLIWAALLLKPQLRFCSVALTSCDLYQ